MEDFASAVVELLLHDICWGPFSDADFEVAVAAGSAVVFELIAASWAEAGCCPWPFEHSHSDPAPLPCVPHMIGCLPPQWFRSRDLHRCHLVLLLEANPVLRMNALPVVRRVRYWLQRL